MLHSLQTYSTYILSYLHPLLYVLLLSQCVYTYLTFHCLSSNVHSSLMVNAESDLHLLLLLNIESDTQIFQNFWMYFKIPVTQEACMAVILTTYLRIYVSMYLYSLHFIVVYLQTSHPCKTLRILAISLNNFSLSS